MGTKNVTVFKPVNEVVGLFVEETRVYIWQLVTVLSTSPSVQQFYLLRKLEYTSDN
jgi:hypothetical protein